jgi:hypothetical protein
MFPIRHNSKSFFQPDTQQYILGQQYDYCANYFDTVVPCCSGKGTNSYRQNLKFYLMQVGNLKLQSNGKADIFYSTEVRATDYLLLYQELTGVENYLFGHSAFWIDGTKHVAPNIMQEGSSQVVNGIYEDDYNRILGSDTEYEVKIYLHYE